MAAVCAHDAGVLVSYLGLNLPVDERSNAVKVTKSDVVAVGATTVPRHDALEHLVRLWVGLPRGVEVWVGGVAVTDQELPSGVRLIDDIDALRLQVIRTLARK